MKAKNRRIVFWVAVGALLSACVAAIAVPPFINLDHLRPTIESAVQSQFGVDIKIHGSVRISLLGRATIGARNLQIPAYSGFADAVSFRIPFRAAFRPNMVATYGTAVLDNARLEITSLSPPQIPGRIVFNNGTVIFGNETYKNINGVFRNNTFNGTVRAAEHRYTISTSGNYFTITNPNARLHLRGQLSTDERGNIAANGNISLETSNANRFFGFETPRINSRVRFRSEFEWANGIVRFQNISGETLGGDFSGDMEFGNDRKRINLVANNVRMDLSFLQENPAFLMNSDIRFSGNGRFRFGNHEFQRIGLSTMADDDTIIVRNFVAGTRDMAISARGRVRDMTADNLEITMQGANAEVHCLMSGTRDEFRCARWSYRDRGFSAIGTLSVGADSFDLEFNSDNYDFSALDVGAQLSAIRAHFRRDNGTVRFNLKDGVHGTASVTGRNFAIEYRGHAGATLESIAAAHPALSLIPESMRRASGTVRHAKIRNRELQSLEFEHTGRQNQWFVLALSENGGLELQGDAHFLVAAFAPNADMKFIRPDLRVNVAGIYRRPFLSGMSVRLGDMEFTGNFDGRAFDLHTGFLDLDDLINPAFIENYDAERFVTAEPLTFPFALNLSLSLTADRIRFGGEMYERFVYSLNPQGQRMSITDSAKGSLLATMDRRRAGYNILVQSNRFEILGAILPATSRFNVADTMLTARASLSTNGFTASDFWRNISGDIDMTFDGGTLIGFDFDGFYDNAAGITRMNAEFAIANALSGGTSALRFLHIAGRYEDGLFRTTTPLTAATRHAEYAGDVQIRRGRTSARLQILLRGTSPVPVPIRFVLQPGGEREYSLSEIMRTFDADFMREFTRINPRF